ncbi:TIGR01440 family protein [Thermus tenuipuniceus]|uniref:TIGR01440 family protein n=1 Tax=Thermus tenuipuniceus TaxID=2078690 RepID=UPI000CF888E3|nr:TIGR01440 family protein [Thermus tenuipuniceus]
MKGIRKAAENAILEFLDLFPMPRGSLFVLGGSTSEVLGEKVGTKPSLEVAEAILEGLLPPLLERGVWVAVQGCEHLNRALVVEKEAARAYGLEEVTVFPHPKAGGSLATAAFLRFQNPVMVESLKAQAHGGMDIGGVLIGMHLRPVAVPLRLSLRRIGEAVLIAAKTRPKLVGGARAVYTREEMLKKVEEYRQGPL